MFDVMRLNRLKPIGAIPPNAWLHIGVLATSTVAALVIWYHCQPFLFPLDDAYITLHNVQVLLSGNDANYGQPALVGTTSSVHLAIVALISMMLPPVAAAFLVVTIGAIIYLEGIVALTGHFHLPLPLAAMITAISALTGYTLYHLFNGLETGWAMAAVTWSIVFALEGPPNRRLALMAGIMPFVRPELGVLSIALMARQSWLRIHTERDYATAFRGIATDVFVAIFAAFPWMLWSWLSVGRLVPGTASAKVAFFAESGTSWAWKFKVMVVALWGGLGPIMLAIGGVKRSSFSAAVVTFMVVFLAVFAVQFPGGLGQNWSRYTCVLLPLCVWALCDVRASGRRVLFAAFMTTSLIFALVGTLLSARVICGGEAMVQDSFAAADWAQAHLPGNAPVLIHDAGAIAFRTRLPLIDLVGLKTPWAVPYHERLTAATNGRKRGEAISEIALKGGAQYAIILHDAAGFWGDIAQELRDSGWRLKLIHSRTQQIGYDVFQLTAPDVPHGVMVH